MEMHQNLKCSRRGHVETKQQRETKSRLVRVRRCVCVSRKGRQLQWTNDHSQMMVAEGERDETREERITILCKICALVKDAVCAFCSELMHLYVPYKDIQLVRIGLGPLCC